jgi:hypothetical protein
MLVAVELGWNEFESAVKHLSLDMDPRVRPCSPVL